MSDRFGTRPVVLAGALYIGSFAIGLGAAAIAFAFPAPERLVPSVVAIRS